jgi:hypothetical protein
MGEVIILGAGLSGLLAARSLQQLNPFILEKQTSLPNNHSALLRFRTDEVAQLTGLPFKQVNVYKGVLTEDGDIINNPTIRDFNAYSVKATGQVSERSIINLAPSKRYIAPNYLIASLAAAQRIQYKFDAKNHFYSRSNDHIPVISTIPMPELMAILEYPNQPSFQYKSIWTVNAELNSVDIYQTLYVPYGDNHPYRVSITGNKMTLEFAQEPEDWAGSVEYYMDLLLPNWYKGDIGTSSVIMKKQDYGKIIPISNNQRQKFILWATDNHNIYSLGRFATWRPILLDDLVKDLRAINKWIVQRNDYDRKKDA